MIVAEDMGYAIKSVKGINQENNLALINNWTEEEEDKWGDSESEISEVSEDWDSMEGEDNKEWAKEIEQMNKVEQLKAILHRL